PGRLAARPDGKPRCGRVPCARPRRSTMESRTKFAGHALHPILIVFPLGLLVTAVAFDLVYLVTDRESFAPAAAFTIAAGLIGGALAGLVGLVDWLALPGGTRAKRVGLLHGAVNLVVLSLFAASWLLRLGEDAWEPTGLAFALGVVGVVLGGFGGWLGGELVERLGV